LHRFFLSQAFCYAPDERFLYLANAKAGSSTMKAFLLNGLATRRETPGSSWVHGPANWSRDYDSALADPDLFTFTVVRNPFTRILSAYLDKIGRPGILRNQFNAQNGFGYDDEVGFEQFLKILAEDTAILDQHYRPQVENTYAASLDLDMVLTLEHLRPNIAALAQRTGLEASLPDKSAHSTDASRKIKTYFSDEAIALTRQIYAADFDLFGYSPEIDNISEAAPEPFATKARHPGDKATIGAIACQIRGDVEQAQKIYAGHNGSSLQDRVQRTILDWNETRADYDMADAEALLAECVTPNDKPAILDFLSFLATHRNRPDLVEDTALQMVHIAPYFPKFRALLIDTQLIQSREQDAFGTLENLFNTCWRVPPMTPRAQEFSDLHLPALEALHVKRQESNPDMRPLFQDIARKKTEEIITPDEPRSFKTAFEPEFLTSYHKGVMDYSYKGVSCLKSPIDLAIYMKLFWDVKPGTIIEIGSFHGGAALFYQDLCRNYGLETQIVTVDFRKIEANPTTAQDTGIRFIHADAENLADSDLHPILDTLPRPWVIIEDSAHTFNVSHAVMTYFSGRLKKGEYLIIEDGVIEDQGANWRYDGGPNRAVHEFFRDNPDVYEIDTHYNDFFGVNASFNPNGYLRKT
jgi:cephalosporin hydroxylase